MHDSISFVRVILWFISFVIIFSVITMTITITINTTIMLAEKLGLTQCPIVGCQGSPKSMDAVDLHVSVPSFFSFCFIQTFSVARSVEQDQPRTKLEWGQLGAEKRESGSWGSKRKGGWMGRNRFYQWSGSTVCLIPPFCSTREPLADTLKHERIDPWLLKSTHVEHSLWSPS